MFTNLLRGAAAGAAGTTALNATTYADMAIRARPASSTPQQAVDEMARRGGHPVPGEGEEHENRLQGLGPLTGILTGVGIGMAAGLLRPIVTRLPLPIGAAALGAAAMAGANVPLSKLGLTDVSSWSTTDWISDVVPHLSYGLVTFWTLRGERR
ncbi:MAG TPA: hypothetical protein VFE40_10720 [Jatrophihabitantaceae bacterium]|jgi:hypothetical protein|nr:hypothetical protein [Jatrophihabitantaceae bacterium]